MKEACALRESWPLVRRMRLKRDHFPFLLPVTSAYMAKNRQDDVLHIIIALVDCRMKAAEDVHLVAKCVVSFKIVRY